MMYSPSEFLKTLGAQMPRSLGSIQEPTSGIASTLAYFHDTPSLDLARGIWPLLDVEYAHQTPSSSLRSVGSGKPWSKAGPIQPRVWRPSVSNSPAFTSRSSISYKPECQLHQTLTAK